MIPQEALEWSELFINNLVMCNVDSKRRTLGLQAMQTIKSALEKQIPKKPYKEKEHKQNDYYCSVCKRYLGDETELKYACLQPTYCEHCGQALDWGEEE